MDKNKENVIIYQLEADIVQLYGWKTKWCGWRWSKWGNCLDNPS